MSIIAWDGMYLAADKCSIGGFNYGTITKIFKIRNSLVGIAGTTIMMPQLLKWIEDPENVPMPESQKNSETFSLIMEITEDRKIRIYENAPLPWTNEIDKWAIGSAADMAIGAMHAGASALEAVSICSKYAPHCGMGMDVLTF